MLIIGLCAYAETRLCSDGSGGAEELTPPRGLSTQLLLKIFSTRHNFFFVKVLFFFLFVLFTCLQVAPCSNRKVNTVQMSSHKHTAKTSIVTHSRFMDITL